MLSLFGKEFDPSKIILEINSMPIYGFHLYSEILLDEEGITFTLTGDSGSVEFLSTLCNCPVKYMLSYKGQGYKPLQNILDRIGKGEGLLYIKQIIISSNSPTIKFNISPS